MGPLGGGLIAMGVTCFYFAFLGWFGARNEYPSDRLENAEEGSVAARHTELAPRLVSVQTDMFNRHRRPLVVAGGMACLAGVAVVLVDVLI